MIGQNRFHRPNEFRSAREVARVVLLAVRGSRDYYALNMQDAPAQGEFKELLNVEENKKGARAAERFLLPF